jgi:urocanate hydratase
MYLHSTFPQAVSIGYHGNVVNLWERLVEECEKTGELMVDMGSDQTSCHNPFNGGYYPVQLGYEESQQVSCLRVRLSEEPDVRSRPKA